MLGLVGLVFLILFLLIRKWRTWQLQEWVREQLDVASFRYAGEPSIQQRLHLRATENRRLKGAFGIDNSLTTESLPTHQVFLRNASRVLNKGGRSWEELYGIARTLIDAELETAAAEGGQASLRLAESVRCMILAVVLFDSFGVDPTSIPRSSLVTITQEINKQWLQSKCHPDDVTPSPRLNSTIAALNINHPFSTGHAKISPAEVLSLLMPQYETLWRVVLLTFVTAYHHQPDAYLDATHRTATVPSCLGNPTREQEALKLAKEGLRLYPSNKHLYRAAAAHPPHHPTPPGAQGGPPSASASASASVSADISTLHRHAPVWGRHALAFRPARFDDGVLTARQTAAYIPFSVKPHKCPAAGNGFGERMVVVLVVALGRGLGVRRGRVVFGDGVGVGTAVGGRELPTGRDAMEGWRFVLH